MQARVLWAHTTARYLERSVLILVGLSLTVVAGFLSQVWGTAEPAFRYELARQLYSLGALLIFAVIMIPVRITLELCCIDKPARAYLLIPFWSIIPILVYGAYGYVFLQIGIAVVKYAKTGT